MAASTFLKEWEMAFRKECEKVGVSYDQRRNRKSREGFPLAPLYSGEDDVHFPGRAPYRRGVYASMYQLRPWTIRQYAGFSTAKESNAFYKEGLKKGQKGLSVAFDLPTHRGYDSDHERAKNDVGKAGVAIDSVWDMEDLFQGIPLDQVSVSMTMNGAVLPVMGAFIVAAEKQGVATDKLSGTIQNDILKEFMVRNTYIYPVEPSMRIVGDIIEFCAQHMPRFNSISISGYHMHEAGADAVTELAFTLGDGIEYVKEAINRGLSVDDFAPRLSFFFGIGMHFFTEVAKLRAARQLWAELMAPFEPQNPKSSMLRTHCQTSGWSLTEQDPVNNVVRTTVEAMAAVLGGTQSLHTNSFDEAIALPTDFSARIARNTQLILKDETDLCTAIDPLGGSHFVEYLTDQLIEGAKKILLEIEEQGGMRQAIESGFAKAKIEEQATQRQAQIDAGEQLIVGVNAYQSEDASQQFGTRKIAAIRAGQVERLEKLRQERDEKAWKKYLEKLATAAKEGQNLMPPVVEAMRSLATVGEVSEVLEKVFSRYDAPVKLVSNVYARHMESYGQEKKVKEQRARVETFATKEGRQPRILVAKLGQDGHDRGAHIIASGFSDFGFDVDLGALFATPKEVARQAVENDVHVIGISSLAAAHEENIQELRQHLESLGSTDIIIVVGGVIPREDVAALKKAGVQDVFLPGTPVIECVKRVLDLLESPS